jgi:hypothetical protein
MKKIIFSIIGICLYLSSMGQAAWVEPENPDVTKKVRIYCNIAKATSASADGMKSNPDGPFYIWTWNPNEARVDSLLNGSGDKPWKNSNETMRMTKDPDKGANVWYYEMVPVLFYGVDANTVYAKGISFLVKPKDGGGYGDPDSKTEDFNLPITPPKLNRGIVYAVPATIFENEITSLVYDNLQEPKTTMQNLPDGEAYMHIIATIEDTATLIRSNIEPAKFFKVQENPKLQMKKMADGRFKITMIPRRFFNIPNGSRLVDIEATVRKKTYNSSDDQTNEKNKLKAGCQ